MPQSIDVYRQWLGITETARPLNYYQLLRLKQFEDDPAVVRSHYRKMNAHVRKFATGDYAVQSQDLLNELAKAMLCLTDATRKGEYDASLGRDAGDSGRRRTLEELLIGRKVIDTAQLEKARAFAKAVGMEVHDAVVQQKMAKPEVVMQVYADSLGLPFVELADLILDTELMERIPAYVARQHSCAPVLIDDGKLLMASPNPLHPTVEDDLRLRLGMPVRSVLCTPAAINVVVNQYYPKEKASAEMAAAHNSPGGAQPAAATNAAGKSMSAEELAEMSKRRRNVALITFNFTFMGVMFYKTMWAAPPSGFFASAPLALAIGAAAGGTAFLLMRVLGK